MLLMGVDKQPQSICYCENDRNL